MLKPSSRQVTNSSSHAWAAGDRVPPALPFSRGVPRASQATSSRAHQFIEQLMGRNVAEVQVGRKAAAGVVVGLAGQADVVIERVLEEVLQTILCGRRSSGEVDNTNRMVDRELCQCARSRGEQVLLRRRPAAAGFQQVSI